MFSTLINMFLALIVIFAYVVLAQLVVLCWIEVIADFNFVYLAVAICLTIVTLLPIGYFYDKYAKEKETTEPTIIKQELQLIEDGCHD